jgi:hypothetical protein
MVREALAGALPPHRYTVRPKPKLDAALAFIDWVLDKDRREPRKQLHRARRIYRRILMEFSVAAVAGSTVRNHLGARKRAMGLVLRSCARDLCSADQSLFQQRERAGQQAVVLGNPRVWASVVKTAGFGSDQRRPDKKQSCSTHSSGRPSARNAGRNWLEVHPFNTHGEELGVAVPLRSTSGVFFCSASGTCVAPCWRSGTGGLGILRPCRFVLLHS